MRIMICSEPQCQSSAGCVCSWVLPRSDAQPIPPIPNQSLLSSFSDAEIAAEYHRRMHMKLGDQTVGVSVPGMKTWQEDH